MELTGVTEHRYNRRANVSEKTSKFGVICIGKSWNYVTRNTTRLFVNAKFDMWNYARWLAHDTWDVNSKCRNYQSTASFLVLPGLWRSRAAKRPWERGRCMQEMAFPSLVGGMPHGTEHAAMHTWNRVISRADFLGGCAFKVNTHRQSRHRSEYTGIFMIYVISYI
jgi:hypothetical protein